MSVLSGALSIRELLYINRPPGCTMGSNLSRDGRFITMAVVGSVTMGDAMGSSETTTEQLAVPPRISGPYDGIHDTFLPSCILAYDRICPITMTPWPPNPAMMSSSTIGLPLSGVSGISGVLNSPRG